MLEIIENECLKHISGGIEIRRVDNPYAPLGIFPTVEGETFSDYTETWHAISDVMGNLIWQAEGMSECIDPVTGMTYEVPFQVRYVLAYQDMEIRDEAGRLWPIVDPH